MGRGAFGNRLLGSRDLCYQVLQLHFAQLGLAVITPRTKLTTCSKTNMLKVINTFNTTLM